MQEDCIVINEFSFGSIKIFEHRLLLLLSTFAYSASAYKEVGELGPLLD